MAKRLIATREILYQSRIYGVGAELPSNAALAPIWVECGAAYWRDDDAETPSRVKAKPLAAPAGITGDAQPATSAEPDLVGKVPSPKARGVVKNKSKRAPKRKD